MISINLKYDKLIRLLRLYPYQISALFGKQLYAISADATNAFKSGTNITCLQARPFSV